MKTLIIAFALTLAPTLALAAGCHHGSTSAQTQSCASGTTYDAEAGACVPVSS